MKILINNEFPGIKVDARKIEQQTGKVLTSLDCNEHEISILFIGDQRIRDLNQQFRDIDRPTDVLSFPQISEDELEAPGALVLGDVAISLEFYCSFTASFISSAMTMKYPIRKKKECAVKPGNYSH